MEKIKTVSGINDVISVLEHTDSKPVVVILYADFYPVVRNNESYSDVSSEWIDRIAIDTYSAIKNMSKEFTVDVSTMGDCDSYEVVYAGLIVVTGLAANVSRFVKSIAQLQVIDNEAVTFESTVVFSKIITF